MTLMGADWIVGVVLALGGALAGGFLVRIFGADSGREKQLQQELERTRKELSDYRSDVETHFRETADAVNAMTESYRHVYEQLRAGASRLCGDGGRLLDLQPTPRVAAEAEDTVQAPGEPETPAAESPPPSVGADAATAPAAEEAAVPSDEAARATDEPAPAAEVPAETSAEAEEAQSDEPRAPLDYAAEGDEAERDKTLH